MSPHCVDRRRRVQRFPRVSGDEPGYGNLFITVTMFSPRERG